MDAAFQSYKGGALQCTAGTEVNHAVQAIGCGFVPRTDDSNMYDPVYIIKNQWGEGWGLGGTAYILRTAVDGGNCAIATWPYTVL